MVAQQVSAQMGLRHKLYLEMEPHARSKPGLSRTNSFIVSLVLLSFLLFALETEPTITGPARDALAALNLLVLIVFAMEYVVRLWVAEENPHYRGAAGRIRFILSSQALTDLAAFLPELVWLLMPHTGDDSMLMFLRVLRLVRLLKIARFVPAFDVMRGAVKRAGGQLLTALALALALVFLSAVLLYFIEGVGQGRPEFASIPRAIWWAIAALTTVGYGDVYPKTALGQIAGSIIAMAGIGVVALPAGIFASAFADELREQEKSRRSALSVNESRAEASEARRGRGTGQPSSD